MQARRGAVEADVAGDRSLDGKGIEPCRVGTLVDEAALFEHAHEIGLEHSSRYPGGWADGAIRLTVGRPGWRRRAEAV